MVLGLGMAITVAPLTTVVMNSIPQDRAGTASGINNAVARVAGVLAIAVFGIVMVKTFGWQLNRSLAHYSLPAQILQEIQSHEIDLAAMKPPTGLDPDTRAAVMRSILSAFVYGFRVVMLLCSGLSLTSCLVAWLMIPKNPRGSSDAAHD